MNRNFVSAIAFAVASLTTFSSGAAFAAGPNGERSRDEVRAELAAAIRSGDMVGNSASGQKLNELFPGLYPQKALAPVAQAVSRAQVRADLAEALRTGDVVANSESGQKAKELFPGLYPQHAASPGKSRAQVRAELADAIRTGDMVANSESGQKFNELMPQLYRHKAAQNHGTGQVLAKASGAR